MESYQVIIHTGDSLSRNSAPGRPFPLDAIDKMLQSATYGVQIFESTSNLPASPALSEVRPPSEEQPPPEPQQPPQAQEPATNGTAPAVKKQVRWRNIGPSMNLLTVSRHRIYRKRRSRPKMGKHVWGAKQPRLPSGVGGPWVRPIVSRTGRDTSLINSQVRVLCAMLVVWFMPRWYALPFKNF